MFNSNQAFLLVQKLNQPTPMAFTQGVEAKILLLFFNLPQVTNKCWTTFGLVLAPRQKKREKNTIKFGKPICNPKLGANVPAFITILMSM